MTEENYKIKINNKIYESKEDKTLLRFLRDDLNIISVKDGCSQGACGTCTVIIDGKNVKACTQKLSKLEVKEITTLEGFTQEEREIYSYAFARVGAVQCGFCTPGMMISAKALLDSNPNPTIDDVKKAINGNICRCTGYKKIEKAILLISKILFGKEKIEKDAYEKVGENMIKIDAVDKALGKATYVDDMQLDNMLYASAIRSKYPRAKVLDIDYKKAQEHPGVVKVFTAEDVYNNKVGHIQQDWDVFIRKGDYTRCVGDAICMVVAKDKKSLEEGKKLVEIKYQEEKPVTSIYEAIQKDAPKIHSNGNLCQRRHVTRGSTTVALKTSAYTVTKTFKTPFSEHAFLEPEGALAEPYKNGVKVYSSDQGIYDTRKELSHMFKGELTEDQIVVQNMTVGGGFGGKEDVSAQHLVALAAYQLKQPVKLIFTRDESLAFHPKRHLMIGKFTLGCDKEGNFTALDCDIFFDTGAYASLCGPVLERACTHAVGPYKYQNTNIRGFGYYTNNPPAGAFRGFGVCQSNFAVETLVTLLAEKVGISSWEIRYKNAIEPGEVLPNGQFADRSTALKETLLKVKDEFENNKGHVGIACALKNSGVGVGLPDKGRARIKVNNETVEIYSAASDIGQGSATVFTQMVCQITGLDKSNVKYMYASSEFAPDSGTTSGSRQTLITGEAVRGASAKLKEDLDKGNSLKDLEGKEYFYEFFDPTDPLVNDKKNPKSHVAYGFATHLAIVDPDTRKLTKVVACHDSGKVVNPIAIEGQIEGGVTMSMGYTLTENYKLDNSKVAYKYGTLGLMRSKDVPEIEAITVEKEELLDFALGSKGIGEISSIPTAPAIAGAYYSLDHKNRFELPLRETPYSQKIKDIKSETAEQSNARIEEEINKMLEIVGGTIDNKIRKAED